MICVVGQNSKATVPKSADVREGLHRPSGSPDSFASKALSRLQSTTFQARYDPVTSRMAHGGVYSQASGWRFGETMRMQLAEDDHQAEWSINCIPALRSSARGTVSVWCRKDRAQMQISVEVELFCRDSTSCTASFCSAGVCHRCGLDRAIHHTQW